MLMIYLLIPISILFLAAAILFYLWAIKSNQYEDLEKEGSMIIFDDIRDKKKLGDK